MKSCFAGMKSVFLFLFFLPLIAQAQVAWTKPSSVTSGTSYYVEAQVTGWVGTVYYTDLYKNGYWLCEAGSQAVGVWTTAGAPNTSEWFRWDAHGPSGSWTLGQTSVPVASVNRAPTASVSVDGYGHGATITRPFGGAVNITVRFNAADLDGNLTGIRFAAWHSPNGAFDNGGGVFQPVSGSSGQYTKTVALNANGAWYFWSDVQDSAGASGSSGPGVGGFLINVNESNVAPTIVWVDNPPASVFVNQQFTMRARANDGNGNLHAVNVWKNDEAYSFHGGGNGWELYTDPNGVLPTAPGSITFKARAGDSAGAEAIIYHTVTVPNRDPSVSVQILNSAQAVVAVNGNGRAMIPINGQFYIRVNGSDPDGRLAVLYSRLHNAAGALVEYAQTNVSGGGASSTFGPYTANQVGTWNMWAHAQDVDQTGYQWQGGGWSGTDLPDVEVFKFDQAISFPQPSPQIYNTQLVLNATASSGLGVSYTILAGPATMISGNTITFTGVGSVTVRASQGGDGTYNPAPVVDRIITVNPASQTITFAQPPPQTFGTPLTLNATASSALAVTYEIVSGPATVAVNVITFTGTGSVTVRANQVGNINYYPAPPVDRAVTVAARATAFSFANLEHTYNGTAKTATVTRDPANATFTADLTKGPNAGSYTVSATATGNYTGQGTATLMISKAPQTIQNFPQPAPQSFGTPLTLGATATSGLPVTYQILSGPATVAGNTVTFSGAGSVTVRASQAGDTNYAAAPNIDRTFSVSDTLAPVFTGPAGAPEVLAIGSAGLRMRWNTTDNIGVVRYDLAISRGTTPLQTFTQPVASAAVSSYTHSFAGLTPATVYTISVTIFDAAGNSTTKQWPVSTCPLDVPPTPGYFVFDITTHSVIATWAECEENMSLDYYNIQMETVTMVNGSPVYQLIHSGIVDATPGNGLPVSFSTLAVSLNLSEATRYRLSVQAVDSGNNRSDWGREQFTTIDVTPPGKPAGLAHDDLTQTGLRLRWSPVTDNSGVVKYEVHQLVAGTGWVPIHLSISGTSQVIGNLTPGTGYSFAVRARDDAIDPAGTSAPNYSALSAAHLITTLPPSPAITSPATWTIPQNAYVNPYQITALNSPTSFGVTGSLPTGLSLDSTLGRISGMPTQAGTRAVSISATNPGGTTQQGLNITVVANGLVAGAAVDSGVPSNRFNGRLYIKPTQTLTLQPSGSALLPFVIDWVDHEVVRPDSTVAHPVQTNPTDFFHPLSYLPDGAEGVYRYRVRVMDTVDDFIEATADFTVDGTAPTAVTNFGVAPGAAQSRSVTLSWNASTDLNGVVNYRIEGAILGGTPIVTSSLSAPLNNLQPGASYPLTIVALDAAGNVSNSAAAVATTLVELTSPGTWSISSGSVEGFALMTAGSASSYSVTSGTLPPGLSLNATTGLLTGSVSSPGTYTFTLGAHNAGGVATQTFTITVNPSTLPDGTRIGFEQTEGFTAGSLTNQVNWAVPHGAAAVSPTSVHGGSTAVELPEGATRPEVTRSYSGDPGESVTFVDLYARPAANAEIEDSTVVELDVSRVAFKQVGANAVVQGYDGVLDRWRASGASKPTGAGGTTNDWIRLTIRLDYTAKAWDLYVDGQVQLFDLGFTDPTLTAFNILKVRGATAGTAFLDDVLVSFNNPLFTDTDKDGMPDDWETANGLNPNSRDRGLDPDGDGLTNFEEYLLHTNPANPDTDGDGISDGQEIALGLNPTVPDGFWNRHTIVGHSLPSGADFLIIDGEGGVHSVTKSTLIINAQ